MLFSRRKSKLPPASSPDAPDTIGPYQLIRPLGEGAVGTVWLAQLISTGERVAVKVVAPEKARSERALARFELEARSTALLTSPHVVRVWGHGTTKVGGYYVALEYIQGIDLQELVSRYGPAPQERAVHFAEQVCEALSDAHDHGVVHRDLKPGNIMVSSLADSEDLAKVVDFGLVRAIGCDRDAVTTPENISGTPAYLAPEVILSECRGECEVDGRADLYALGCVLYWLLTGVTVFDAPTPHGQAIAHATEAPRPASSVATQPIAPPLEELILACLSKNPADRPADARTLHDRLWETGLSQQWTAEHAREWWLAHPFYNSASAREARG